MSIVWQSYGKYAYDVLTLADFPHLPGIFTAFFAEKSFFCYKMSLLARALCEKRHTEKSEDGNPQPHDRKAGTRLTAEEENNLWYQSYNDGRQQALYEAIAIIKSYM